MATTASQKLAAVLLPVSAVLLAAGTSDPSWNPKHEQGSWREVMHPELKGGGVPAAPPEAPAKPATPGEKEGVETPVPAGKTPAEETAKAPEKPAEPEKPAPKTVEAPAPKTPEPPKGLEFKVSGLATAATAVPLTTPLSLRLDIHVLGTGAVRMGSTMADPEMALVEIRTAPQDKREKGLLFLVPQARAGWDDVLALASAGAAAGWKNIALCAASPQEAAQGRVLLLDIPANEAPTKKALDILLVTVKKGAGSTSGYALNGEDLENVGRLRAKATSLHSEYEQGFEEGYSLDPDQTPWTIDGAGASAGGVIAALDAMRDAGIKCVRLAGLRRPGTEDGK